MRTSQYLTILKKYGIIVLAVIFLSVVGYRELSGSEEKKVAAAVSEHVSAVGPIKNADYYGAKRAELAMSEYQLGVRESTPGCNCGKEVDKYTEGYRSQWCTMFASWITMQAGSPMVNEKTGKWKLTNSRDFAENLQKNGTWYSREEVIQKGLEPKPGDFVVYWRGDYSDELGHVDIVVNSGKEPGYADTIGGNLHDKVELRNFPYRDNWGFMGFGRPEKSL